MLLTPEEKVRYIQLKGLDPALYDIDDETVEIVKRPTLQPAITGAPASPISKQQQNNTAVGAFAANMGAGIVPTAAALTGAKVVGGLAGRWLGAKAGAGAGAAVGTVAAPGPGTIVGTVAGGLLGALGGGYIASKAQGAALEALAPSANRALESYQETNPIASAAGNVAAALPLGMRFDPKVIGESGTAIRKLVSGGRSRINEVDINALANVGIGAGVGGGMAAYDINQTGREIGAQDAVNVIGNILLNNPRTGFANKIGMEANEAVRAREYARGAIGGLAEDDPNVILGVSGKSPTDAGPLFVPANVADKKGAPAKTYRLDPNKKNVVDPIIAEAKQKTADIVAAVETVKAVQEEEVKQAAKIAEVTAAPAKPSEAAMEQARLKREAYAKSLIKPSTAVDATLTRMDAATTEAEVDALRAELQAEQRAEELARIQADAPQERDQPSSGIAERKGVIVPALDAAYPPRAVGKNEKGEDVRVKSWGLNPAFVKLFKRFAGTRNTGLEANTKEGDSGRSYITTKDGRNTVYLGDNASLDTPAHEIGFHSVHDYLATSKSKIDRELLRKHFEAIRKSPEMQQWYNDLGKTEAGRIRRAKLDRERYVRGDIDVPAAVEEFSAEVGGYDFLLTDRAISGESATKKLFNDIIAHVDTRINDKPSLKNLQRHMAYRARFDAPYDPNARIDVKTAGERERNAGDEPQAPAYDPNLSGAENMRIAAEWGAKHPADIATLEPSIKPLTNERDNEGGRYRNDARYQNDSELFAEELGDFNWRARPAVEYREQQAERAMQKQSREELSKRIQQFADEAFGNLSSDAYVRYQMAKDYIERPDAVARKSKSNSTFADSKPLHEHAVDMLGEQRISRFFSDIQAISDKKASFGERNQPASELLMFPDDKQPIRNAEAFYESHASRAKLRNLPIEMWSLEEVGAYTGLSRQAISELRKKYGQAYDFHTHAANRYPQTERDAATRRNRALTDAYGNRLMRDRPLQLKVDNLNAAEIETIRMGVVDTMHPKPKHAVKGTAQRNAVVRALVNFRFGKLTKENFKAFEREMLATVAGRIKAEGLDNDPNTTPNERLFKTAGRISQQELKQMYRDYMAQKARGDVSLNELNRVGNERIEALEDAGAELPGLEKAREVDDIVDAPASIEVISKQDTAPLPAQLEVAQPKQEGTYSLASVFKTLRADNVFDVEVDGEYVNDGVMNMMATTLKKNPDAKLSEAEFQALMNRLEGVDAQGKPVAGMVRDQPESGLTSENFPEPFKLDDLENIIKDPYLYEIVRNQGLGLDTPPWTKVGDMGDPYDKNMKPIPPEKRTMLKQWSREELFGVSEIGSVLNNNSKYNAQSEKLWRDLEDVNRAFTKHIRDNSKAEIRSTDIPILSLLNEESLRSTYPPTQEAAIESVKQLKYLVETGVITEAVAHDFAKAYKKAADAHTTHRTKLRDKSFAESNERRAQFEATRNQPASALDTDSDTPFVRLMVTSLEKELTTKARPFNLQVDKQGLLNSAEVLAQVNKLNPIEQKLLKQADLEGYLKSGGNKVSAQELASWLKNNGPKVDVHNYGMEGKVSEAKREYDRMTHEWWDNEVSTKDKLYINRHYNSLISGQTDIGIIEETLDGLYPKNSVDKIIKYLELKSTVEHQRNHDTSPRATSYYDTVSAFDTKEPMPEWTTSKEGRNVQRVDVVIPPVNKDSLDFTQAKAGENSNQYQQRFYKEGGYIWHPDGLHENLPNTLGWAMIQYKTIPGEPYRAAAVKAPDGTVYEGAWHGAARDKAVKAGKLNKWASNGQDGYVTKSGKWVSRNEASNEAGYYVDRNNYGGLYANAKPPLHGEKRVALIAEAQSRWGQQVREAKNKPLANITAEEQSKMVNKHDHPLLRDYNRLILKAAIEQARKEGATHVVVSDAETAMMTEGHDVHGATVAESNPYQADTGTSRVDQQDANRIKMYGADWKDGKYVRIYRGGMIAESYRIDKPENNPLDKVANAKQIATTGRLLSQEPGMRLNYDTILPKIAEDLTGVKGERISLGEHKNAFSYIGSSNPDARIARDNLIFNNPDGTPKTDVSGMMYDISLPKSRRESGEQMTMTGRRYQDASALDDPNTPTPKSDSWFGIEPVLDEMVRHHGNVGSYMADKFRLAKENESALFGRFANKALEAVDTLLAGPKDWILGYNDSTKKVVNALNYMSDNGAMPSHISLTPKEQKVIDTIRDLFVAAHEEQRANGPMVARMVDGKTIYDAPKDNPYYMPHIMAPDVIEQMMKFPAGTAARKYREDFRTYRRALGQSDSEIDDALVKFQPNKSGTATTPDYNAVRMEEGLGLPKSWREQDLSRLLRRYYSRWATDMGFYRAVQSDPAMRKLLDIKDDGQGNLGNAVMADTLPNGENIRDVNMNSTPEVQTVMRDFGGSYPVSDVKVNAINRLIKSFMMQTATGLYDVTTALPVAAKLLRPSEIGLMGKALLKWKEGRQIGYDNGTIRRGVSSIQDLRGLDTGLSNTLDMITNTVNKITGREGLEGVARGLTNELGYLVNESRLSGARAGKAEDIKWYKQLGIKDWQTRDVADVGKEVAARFTELNQGTYDYRGLPRWAIEGSLSPFLSLAKWNIEQFNNWNKTVINPAREGNYTPLLMSTVGAIVGGAAVEELRKLINNRKPTQLTNEEWWNTTEDTAYKLAALASLSGYAGIMGELAKNVTFDIHRGNRPQGFTFPLAETAANTVDRINQLMAALDENIKPSEALIPFIQNLITDNIQVARMAERLNERVNEPEKAEQAAASRDARVFKQVIQDERVDSSSARTNPMLRPDERTFKKTESIEEAATILPKIVEDAIKRSGGDYEKLKREMQRLKGNNIQTFPSPETNPVEFAKQYAWYVQAQGKEAADAAVARYLKQRAINKEKARWIPKL